nr:SDR family oxidoreductase [Secundilactobacillus paracollinoides]
MILTKITLVTGADRGMGLEIVKELAAAGQHVLLGTRNIARGQAAITQLGAANVDPIQLDVADDNSVQAAATQIKDQCGRLDCLINNAGIALDNYEAPSTIPVATIRKDFDVNFFGLITVTQAMLPLLKLAPSAKIINVSSAVGSLTLASDATTSIYQHSAVGYQASKTAVNMFTVDLANELSDTTVTVNAVNPGWVDTSFAGGGGDKTVQEGVARTVELALLATNDITGTFSDTQGIVPW